MWRIEHTVESRLALGVSQEIAEQFSGVPFELAFDDARWGGIAGCGGPYHLKDGLLRLGFELNEPDCGTTPVDLRWVAAGADTAQATMVSPLLPADIAVMTGTWQRIGDAPTTLGGLGFIGDQPVPSGSYRIEVTVQDLQAAGASAEFANSNAGTWTWTFTPGSWAGHHLPYDARCGAAMSVAEGHVELADTPSDPCTLAYDLRWRPEGDDLRFQLLDLNWMEANARVLADERALIERVWTKVE